MQPELFNTTITCSHCGRPLRISDNPSLLEGFLDKDTNQHVCGSKQCRNMHYFRKQGFRPSCTIAEFPILVPALRQRTRSNYAKKLR